MSVLAELSGSLVRHPRGAWGNRTHSFTGRLYVGRERIAFYAVRNFDRDAKTGERVSWDVALNRPGSNRELSGKKWEAARIAVKSEFRAAIEKALADDETAARAEMVSREAADDMGFTAAPVTSHPVTIGTQETVADTLAPAVDPDRDITENGVTSGLTGPDWEPTPDMRFFAQRDDRGAEIGFGATREAAIGALAARPVLIANTTRACYWRTPKGFVATGPNVRVEDVSYSAGAYPRLDALMRLKGEDRDAIERALRHEMLRMAATPERPPVDPTLEALGALATAANEIAHCAPPPDGDSGQRDPNREGKPAHKLI